MAPECANLPRMADSQTIVIVTFLQGVIVALWRRFRLWLAVHGEQRGRHYGRKFGRLIKRICGGV